MFCCRVFSFDFSGLQQMLEDFLKKFVSISEELF